MESLGRMNISEPKAGSSIYPARAMVMYSDVRNLA
jgi:hypothetical protein